MPMQSMSTAIENFTVEKKTQILFCRKVDLKRKSFTFRFRKIQGLVLISSCFKAIIKPGFSIKVVLVLKNVLFRTRNETGFL